MRLRLDPSVVSDSATEHETLKRREYCMLRKIDGMTGEGRQLIEEVLDLIFSSTREHAFSVGV